jgi:hypothetical protein
VLLSHASPFNASGKWLYWQEDLVGHVTVDAREFAAGKKEVLFRFMSESNGWASERDCSYAARISWDQRSKSLPRHHARRKNLTPDASHA